MGYDPFIDKLLKKVHKCSSCFSDNVGISTLSPDDHHHIICCTCGLAVKTPITNKEPGVVDFALLQLINIWNTKRA